MVTGVWSKAMAQSEHSRSSLGVAAVIMFVGACGPMIIALRTRDALQRMFTLAHRLDPAHKTRGWANNRPYGTSGSRRFGADEFMFGGWRQEPESAAGQQQ